MNMSKSGKSAYFHHVFANNFFCIFLKTFSTDLKSAWNSAVFDNHIEFLKGNFFFALISMFSKLWMQIPRRKTKNLFYERILEFNMATINGLEQTNRCILLRSRLKLFSQCFRQCSGSASYVFGPPRSASGSVIYLYGSGSLHKPAKKLRKTLISTVLWLLYPVCLFIFELLKKDVNVPSKRKSIKTKEKKLFFFGILKVTDEKSRVRIC